MAQFRGKTEDASAPFLKAEFWEKGRRIAGTVERIFETDNGKAYVVRLVTPVMLNGQSEKQVSIGNSAGLRMAVDASGCRGLEVGDSIHLECTGTSETGKGNDQVNFEIEVNRPDSNREVQRAARD